MLKICPEAPRHVEICMYFIFLPKILEVDGRLDPFLCWKPETFSSVWRSERFFKFKDFFFFNFDCLWPVQVFELVFQVCWADAPAPCSTAPQSCSLPATYAVLGTSILKLSAKLVQLVHVHINPPTHSFHSKMSKIMGSFQKNLKHNGLRFLLWQIHKVND